MKPVVILGGPGDGVVVARSIEERGRQQADLRVAGFLNDVLPSNSLIGGLPVLGRLEDWHRLPEAFSFIAALHKVKQMEARAVRILGLGIPEARWASVVDPAASIADDAAIGHGSFIGPHAVVQPGCRIGNHVSIRAGANLGHDVSLADFAYVGPNATLCGRARMERGAHLGPNACVADGKVVGEFAVVGICSAVTKNVPGRAVVIGVPARRVSGLAEA